MRRAALVAISLAIGALATVAGAGPAGAASASGCHGAAKSLTSSGRALDQAAAPGSGGTSDHPFEIEYDGSVSYQATTDDALQNGTWNVKSSVFTFGGDVGGTDTSQSGTEKVSDHVPFTVPGLYKVTITADAPGKATCSVTGWIRIVDSPVGSPLWIAALVLIVLGVPFLYFAMPTEKR
jgi:hypothetical protein